MDDAEGVNPEVFEAHLAGDDYGISESLGEGGHWDSIPVSSQGGEGGGYDSLLTPAVGEGEVGCWTFQVQGVCDDQFRG